MLKSWVLQKERKKIESAKETSARESRSGCILWKRNVYVSPFPFSPLIKCTINDSMLRAREALKSRPAPYEARRRANAVLRNLAQLAPRGSELTLLCWFRSEISDASVCRMRGSDYSRKSTWRTWKSRVRRWRQPVPLSLTGSEIFLGVARGPDPLLHPSGRR